MRKNWQLIFSIIFIGIGLIFAMTGGLMGSNSWHMVQSGKSVVGNVVGMIESRDSDGVTYKPQVSYIDDEGVTQNWTSSMSSNPPCCEVGEEITLLIDPTNPKHISINKFSELWLFPMVFGGMGLLFVIIGGIVLIVFIKHKQDNAWLKDNGQRIEADFSTIGRGNVEINGQKPWVIICQWQNPANGEMVVFKSDQLWYEPSNFLTKGQKIGVLIDPKNIKKYYVDLSFLPKG